MSIKKKLVMVGNGMAGMKAIETILDINPDMFEITVIGAEKYPNYNRILLSSVLAGEMSIEDIIINDEKWYFEKEINLSLNNEVTEIQRGYKKVITRNGNSFSYDVLIIATGSNPFIIPILGVDKDGVITFRDINDCCQILKVSKNYKKAAVIGGGLLGLEAAKGLINLNMETTVIHNMSTLMDQQLDAIAGNMLKEDLLKQGLKFRLPAITTEIMGNGRVTGLKFADNSELKCDLVVMTTGIRPNIELAKKARIYCNRGIIVNDCLQTITDPSIYALGECVEHRNTTYGLVAPLFDQARILAYQITGQGLKSYIGSDISSKLKVSGIDLFSAGDHIGDSSSDIIEYCDKSGGVYKKLVTKDNTIVGTVLYGDIADGPRYFQLIQGKVDISEQRNHLLFGTSTLGDTGHSGFSHVSAMSPDTIVCGCNGITFDTIKKAILENGYTTRQEVTKCTKASGSCGGCSMLVEQIIASLLGLGAVTSNKDAPLCECSELTHETIKKEIKDKQLATIQDVMQTLKWNGDGCDVCRPAINYYVQLLCPKKAKDDRYSRAVNERMHANIQNDGTFSVIPRMYGGVTSADNLIRIGEVAKKYNVVTVKLTGGQRIGLFGIKKEELIPIWEELGMLSGFAYGKSLRTVKTCVGSSLCRFGTQDSMALGIKIEKILERMWAPAKVKIAVSGCPRNCAEASIKDIGIVGVTGAWELYCGGNGGVKIRPGDLLCTVSEEEEVIAIVKAYLRFYLEDARYGERTALWIDRVGMERIKHSVIEDRESRTLLTNRMDDYLATLTADPWKERISAKEMKNTELLIDYKVN